MAFQEVKTRETFRLQNFEGKAITGYYLGKTESDGEFGKNIRHEFYSKEKGEKFSFWGVTDLSRKLANVKLGSLVKFTYKGKEMRKVRNSMKEMHSVEVLNDPGNILDGFEELMTKQSAPAEKEGSTKVEPDNMEEVPF